MEAIVTSAALGAIVTLVAQMIKKWAGSNTTMTYAVVGVLSLIVAAVYNHFMSSEYWPIVVQVVAYAGAIYTFLVSRFPGASSNS